MQKTETEKTKLNYWQKRAVTHLPEMRAAKAAGLFPRKEGWRNVVEHELVEAEAGDVLAEMLNLPILARQDIYHAALVHDVFKRIETEMIEAEGSEGYQISQAEQAKFLRQRGYSERIIDLTKSAGGGSLLELLENPEAEQLKVKVDVDLAKMIVHYVDDITLNHELVPLKKRIEYLVNKPRYQVGNQKGRAIFAGRTYFEVQEEVSRQIEARLASILSIEKPEDLPGIIRGKILERIEQERLKTICLEASDAARKKLAELGDDAKKPRGTNRFGETTLEGDFQCEEAVLEILRKHKLNIKVISEEHGEIVIGDKEPEYLGVLDGIDGTRQFLAIDSPDRVFGTMFAIFKGQDPDYDDSLISFIADHAKDRTFIAQRGKGTFLIEGKTEKRINIARDLPLSKGLRIYGSNEHSSQLTSFEIKRTNSACKDYTALLTNDADVVSAYTLKDNLEPATAYLLIKEAGGLMIKLSDGRNLGEEKYLAFGQSDHTGIIATVNPLLAESIYKHT